MSEAVHRGSYMYGSIRFEIEAPLGPFGFYHYTTYHKTSNTAFTTNASVPRDRVRFLNGEETIRRYESSPGTFRCFCPNCGSPIFKESTGKPGVIRIRLGSLDTPVGDKPRAHAFWSERADWYDLKGDMPVFDTWPDLLKGK